MSCTYRVWPLYQRSLRTYSVREKKSGIVLSGEVWNDTETNLQPKIKTNRDFPVMIMPMGIGTSNSFRNEFF